MNRVQTITNGHVREHQPKFEQLRLVCPHLGVENDPETWLAFPAAGNCCHYAKPVGFVAMEHQQQFCLHENHLQCPLLLKTKGVGRLPAEMQLPTERPATTRFWPTLLLFIVGLLFIGWLTLNGQRKLAVNEPLVPAGTMPVIALLPSETAIATHTPTPKPSPTATPTPIPNSPTPQNSPTLPPTYTLVPSSTVIPPATIPATATPIPPQIIVLVERLNVRAGPSLVYPSVAVINAGERLNIIGINRSGDWWQVCCVAEQVGWVFGGSVLVEGDTSTVPIVLEIPPTSVATTTP